VQDLSPYLPWPWELRRVVMTNFRDMRFTFDFN
jgi:hypothetical protein